MNKYKTFFITTFLSPIIAIGIISIININTQTKLKFLIWETPKISIGFLMSLGTISGASIALLNSYVSHKPSTKLHRKVHYSYHDKPQSHPEQQNEISSDVIKNELIDIPPERDIREPLPTISTSYRVIRSGSKGPNFYEKQDFDSDSLEPSIKDIPNEPIKSPSYAEQQEDWGEYSDDDW
ncbi:hypothetical protein [Prochlorococcus sp. MIT 1341]|uniref:hypothetical protein n=1 Tax=Prochlorococcus sp. MIT 1341 TaxID=3096221 RepID=UPI002A74D55E|nr:hypothetical protein [Prochlorococcus sp. MIT 1341]